MSESGWYGLSGPSDPNARPEKAEELADEGIRTGPVIVGAAVVVVLIATQLFPKAYPLGVVLKGATLGTGTGLLAVGLVLTYRTTRVINFSHGSMGAVGAALAAGLTRGSLELSWEVALPIGVAAGVLCGAVVEVLVIRRFTKSPRLVLTVATIGLAQVLGGLAFYIPQWFDSPVAINRIESNLSDIQQEVSPVVFNGNDFLLLGAVPVVLGLLTWFLLRTETGMAVRGISENMDRARLLGIPVNRLTLLLWSITGGMAALAVILRTPNEGLRVDIAAGPIILLPALAAAVVTGMRSLTGAFFAGVGFGVLDQIVQLNVDKRAITMVVFLGAILISLVLKRETTSRALQADESSWDVVAKARKLPRNLARLPEVRIFQGALLGIVVLVAAALPMFGSASQIDHATKTLALALAALSLVVLTGWGGVVSLGQYALVGLGAMVTANLIVDRNSDLFVSLGASAVAGGLIALVLGIPALRVSGQFLAVTTLAFAVAMENYFLEPENFGSLLPDDIPRPELWDGRIDLSGQTPLYLLALFLVVATSMVIANLRRARTGRSISATRDNPRSAAAVGINTTEARLAGFVFAGMFAGLAGGIHAVIAGGIGAGAYPAATSLLVFSMAVIGGSSSIGGTLAGVVLIQVLAYYVVPEWQLIITGSGLLVILWLLPGGLARLYETVRDRIAYAAARSQGIQIVDDQAAEQHALPPPAPVDSGEMAIVQQGSLLMCEGVEASYGSLKVLFGIDTVVGQGELLALLGTNGAGKSTLLRSIAGLLPPDNGRVTFDGKDITGVPTEKIAKLGLSMMPGGRGVFPTLTVAENMRLAGWVLRHHRKRRAGARENALALFPILQERWDQMAGDLSGGEQQQLSLAMALATSPKLLCIDELSLGLAPTIVNQLVEKVREIHRAGTSIVVVEQSINIALLLCERAVFLEKGQVRFRGPTAGLLDRPDVLRAVFLGGVEGVQHAPLAGRRTRGMALECRSLVKRFGGIRAVDGVDLIVPPSSIVGLIGHNGAGKTTMFDVLTGFLPADGGQVLLGGVDVTNTPSHRRAIKGLGRSFQEARLYPSLTVTEALKVAMETHLHNRDPLAAALSLPVTMISERQALRQADALIDLLGLGAYRDHLIGELSTGTRRIVELGCLLAHDPAVVLLDEPSAGVAQRETEALGPLLRQVQGETGCSLVVIEHDMALLSSLCDALVALEQGSVIAWGAPDDVLADHRVVASYLGTDNEVVQHSGHGPVLPGHRPEREAGWLTRAQQRW